MRFLGVPFNFGTFAAGWYNGWYNQPPGFPMPKIIKPLTSKEVAAISKIGLTTLGGVANASGQARGRALLRLSLSNE